MSGVNGHGGLEEVGGKETTSQSEEEREHGLFLLHVNKFDE